MKRQIIIDSIALPAFIIGTLLLFNDYAGLRALGALLHYFGAMVVISGISIWVSYFKGEK